MPLAEDFAAAQVRVKQLTRSPGVDELLDLYSLFKQATAGDAGGDAPGAFDFKARAKYDAWQRRKGLSRDEAMQAYVALVSALVSKYE
jgi:diazepam-binding inhibitor (GABA receptor modulator, acyl-CoA-binding protein)